MKYGKNAYGNFPYSWVAGSTAGYPMPKTIFEGAHADLVEVLVEARKKSGLTQTELADLVGKDQTFISLIERSQRRVDVLEFIVLARAMKRDPAALFAEVLSKVPTRIRI